MTVTNTHKTWELALFHNDGKVVKDICIVVNETWTTETEPESKIPITMAIKELFTLQHITADQKNRLSG